MLRLVLCLKLRKAGLRPVQDANATANAAKTHIIDGCTRMLVQWSVSLSWSRESFEHTSARIVTRAVHSLDRAIGRVLPAGNTTPDIAMWTRILALSGLIATIGATETVSVPADIGTLLALEVRSQSVFVSSSATNEFQDGAATLVAPDGDWHVYELATLGWGVWSGNVVLKAAESEPDVFVGRSTNGAAVPKAPTLVMPGSAGRASSMTRLGVTANLPVVGAMLSGWQTLGAQALQNISAAGHTPVTVEDVIRSNGTLQLADILAKYNETGPAGSFYYQATPAMGYYCWYRGGSATEPRVAADCPNITGTLTQEAEWLTAAGVDFVTMDATNLPTWSAQAEAIQVRPQEVLFEEWTALRSAGRPTPAVAAWQTIPTGGTLWKKAVALYNNATTSPLVFRAPAAADGSAVKKVFFVPAPSMDPSIAAEVASQADATVVPMWALFASGGYEAGEWAFMSPCTDAAGAYTTTIAGRGAGTPCGQRVTSNSPIGAERTAIAVGPGYQLAYSSLEQSPGKMGGLTLKRQFATALQAQPEYVYLSSWNEWLAQPQANPYGPSAAPVEGTSTPPSPSEAGTKVDAPRVMSPAARAALAYASGRGWDNLTAGSEYAFSVGLPDDSLRFSLWVDSYGSSLDRDIEPSVQGGADGNGTRLYDIVASCVRVLRLQRVLGGAHAASFLPREFVDAGGAVVASAPCAVAGEACCEPADEELWRPVWSLRRGDSLDMLLTTSPAEVKALLAAGTYAEVCSAYPGVTDWCEDRQVLASHDAVEGPFTLRGPPVFASGGAHAASARAAEGLEAAVRRGRGRGAGGTVPLYRCLDGAQRHLFSTQADCEGLGKVEMQLGTIDTGRSSAAPRALRRCTNADGLYYHALDWGCRTGDTGTAIMGFVH